MSNLISGKAAQFIAMSSLGKKTQIQSERKYFTWSPVSLRRGSGQSQKRTRPFSFPDSLSLCSLTQLSHDKKKVIRKKVKFPSAVLMQQAIMDGDLQEMKQLIGEYGSRVAVDPEPSGLPPVMRCVFESQLAPLRLLVEAGADLAVQDSEHWTTLHVAAAMDDLEAAKYVLGHCSRCLTQVRNVDGQRPIDLAESTAMARLLFEADLKLFDVDKLEEPKDSEESDLTVLGLVREHFTNNGNCHALNTVIQTRTSHDSLLHLAASKNYLRLASYILKHKICHLETRGKKGWTPLHAAAYHNSLDVTLLLIQNGASVHSLANSYERPSDLTSHELIHALLQEEENVAYL